MKKFRKGLCLFLAAVMLLSFLPAFSIGAFAAESDSTFDVWDGSVASGFAGGSGTFEDPYIIETAEQLAYFAESVTEDNGYDGQYISLVNDIVLNDTTNWEKWSDSKAPKNKWDPIGDESRNKYGYPKGEFGGIFNGMGHTISGMYIKGGDFVGLFSSPDDAIVKNVGIEKSYVSGHNYVGAIAGYASCCNIIGCYNSGTVKGRGAVGGIVGNSYFYVYDDSYFYVYDDRKCIGPNGEYEIIYSQREIYNCYNTGDVMGVISIGGIAGKAYNIYKCFNTGDVFQITTYDTCMIGGIVGRLFESVGECYNTGTVSGSPGAGEYEGDYSGGVGGIAGLALDYNGVRAGSIYDSFNCGDAMYAIVGSGRLSITRCYYPKGQEPYGYIRSYNLEVTELEYEDMLEKFYAVGFDSNLKKNDFLAPRCFEHDISENVLYKETCIYEGTIKRTCKNEDCKFEQTVKVPAIGHNYKYFETENNRLVSICTNCESWAPAKVEKVNATRSGDNIKISWDSISNKDWKYYVQILDENLNLIKTRNTTETSLTVGGLEFGKTYAFRVYAHTYGSTYAPNEADVVFVDFAAVENTKVEGVSASTDEERLNISWKAVSGASGYYVYVFENGKQITCKNAGTKTSISFIDGLKPEVDYTVKVIAKVGSKYQSKDVADEVAGRIKEKPLAQTYVKNVTASTNETRLNVYWDAVDGAEVYYVYIYEKGVQITTKNAGTNTSISIIDGLTEETDYTVKVIAKVGGKYMSKDDAMVASGRICAKSPDKVYVTENNPGTVKIAWKAVKGANEYYVRVTDEFGYKKVTRTSNTDLTLGGLEAGAKYNVEVAVQIKRTASNGSNTYTTLNYGAVTEITVAEPVSISVNAEANENAVKVSWSAPQNATTYYVYEKVGDSWKVLITLNNPETCEINIKNAASGEHTYSVVARLTYNGANIYTERFISNTITL